MNATRNGWFSFTSFGSIRGNIRKAAVSSVDLAAEIAGHI
jgi:hypothetical protein